MRRFICGQLILVAVLLIVADGLLWIFAPITTSSFAVSLHQSLPGVKSQIEFRTFAGGLRSLTLSDLGKPAGQLRVLCLGASTTDQATQQVEDTWCGALEQELKLAHPEWKGAFHTLSYGLAGGRALETFVWLSSRLNEIRPDVIVTLMGVNDLVWNGGPDYAMRDIDAALALASSGSSRSFSQLCVAYSQLCHRGVLVWRSLRTSKHLQSSVPFEYHSANLPRLRADYRAIPAVETIARLPDPIDEFKAATGRLLRLLRSAGIKGIVLGQPVIWKPQLSREEFEALWFPVNTSKGFVRPPSAWMHAEMQRYNAAQRELADRHSMAFVDLDAIIPKQLDYYFDDCHFTDKGSHAVARAVLPALEHAIENLIRIQNSD